MGLLSRPRIGHKSPKTIAATTVEMATPAALVAMKLNSYPRGRGASIAKQGSDLQDIVALLTVHNADRAIGRALARAPYGLGKLCAEIAQRLLVDDAGVASGRVRRYTNAEIPAEQTSALGERLVQSIQRALGE